MNSLFKQPRITEKCCLGVNELCNKGWRTISLDYLEVTSGMRFLLWDSGMTWWRDTWMVHSSCPLPFCFLHFYTYFKDEQMFTYFLFFANVSLLIRLDTVSWKPGWLENSFVAVLGLELILPLPLPSKNWINTCRTLHTSLALHISKYSPKVLVVFESKRELC